VLILPQRQTALVAKQAIELDLLSRGRLRLGVGTGWNHVEYSSLGVPFAERGARLDEQVDLLRKLWSDPVISYRGRFHAIDRAGLLPQPARPIPIWFGGFTPVSLRRAARTGDGFLFGTSPGRMLGLLAQLRERLAKEGRADAEFGAEAVVDFSDPHDSWRPEIERWHAAGGTHVSLRAMDTGSTLVGAKHVGYRGPRDYIAALETFWRAIQ
jgi:probable F420-dependent oxidoreductase